MANVTRKRSFFIGLALTGLRPRIVSITKRAIWQANSTLARAGGSWPTPAFRSRVADELADVLLRDPPGRQKLDQVAVFRGRNKSLPPGATCYARHSTTPICKKSFDRSSFGRVNCRFIIGRTISVLWREHQGALL